MSLILPSSEVGPDSPSLFLFRALDEVVFEAVHPMDENRIADAMDLRERSGMIRELGGKPVSLLEIVVVLSMYMSYARENLVIAAGPDRWFFEMLSNAGIGYGCSEEEIITKGKRIVDRTYEPDGRGGLFPLLNGAGCDMRLVELWMQLNAYLVERYHA